MSTTTTLVNLKNASTQVMNNSESTHSLLPYDHVDRVMWETLDRALVNTDVDGKVSEKKSPRVWFFYHNDKGSVHHSVETKIDVSSSIRFSTTKYPRRRVIAYVWDEKTQTVFYAGSVYDPNLRLRGVGEFNTSTLATMQQVCSGNVDLKKVVKKTLSSISKSMNLSPPTWSKKQERVIAAGRLRVRPAVFKTNAKTWEKVRFDIVKHMFSPQAGSCNSQRRATKTLKELEVVSALTQAL